MSYNFNTFRKTLARNVSIKTYYSSAPELFSRPPNKCVIDPDPQEMQNTS